jgi:hypothetical protein
MTDNMDKIQYGGFHFVCVCACRRRKLHVSKCLLVFSHVFVCFRVFFFWGHGAPWALYTCTYIHIYIYIYIVLPSVVESCRKIPRCAFCWKPRCLKRKIAHAITHKRPGQISQLKPKRSQATTAGAPGAPQPQPTTPSGFER